MTSQATPFILMNSLESTSSQGIFIFEKSQMTETDVHFEECETHIVGCKTRSCYVIGGDGSDSKTIMATCEAGSITCSGAK
jgi:hypothetical protein